MHFGTYGQMRDPDIKILASSSGEDPFSHEDHEHDTTTLYKVRQTIVVEQFGYNTPTEQTTYGGGGGHLPERYGNGDGY